MAAVQAQLMEAKAQAKALAAQLKKADTTPPPATTPGKDGKSKGKDSKKSKGRSRSRSSCCTLPGSLEHQAWSELRTTCPAKPGALEFLSLWRRSGGVHCMPNPFLVAGSAPPALRRSAILVCRHPACYADKELIEILEWLRPFRAELPSLRQEGAYQTQLPRP